MLAILITDVNLQKKIEINLKLQKTEIEVYLRDEWTAMMLLRLHIRNLCSGYIPCNSY